MRRFIVIALACSLAVTSLHAGAQQSQQPQYPQPQYPQPQYPQPQYPQQQSPQQQYPQPQYPNQVPGAPGQPYPQQPAPYDQLKQQAPQQRKPSFLRELFVGTIGAILQGVGGVAANTLVQGLTGTIVSWFSRKQDGPQYPTQQYQYPTQPYPTQQYPTQQYPTQQYPTQQYPAQQYPTQQYPTQQYPTQQYPAYATASPYSTEPQMYDTQTGQMLNTSAQAYYSRSTDDPNSLYAGVAYEVHALRADGTSMPVNPLTYAFSTGERFVLYYRPSMPGRMEVYNINPLGAQTRIDSTRMAAGQLAKLGPYEFTATTGRDSLRLVLLPCSTTELLVATRGIVNVPSAPASGQSGFPLSNCDAPATRSVKTRDITKVALDGMTTFAIDPLTAQEYGSGQVDAREIVIVFQHR